MGKRPHPPREPGPDECCGSGCARCVWDVYYDELARYNGQIVAGNTSGEESTDHGVLDDDEDEDEDFETAGEGGRNFIGSVVVKYLPLIPCLSTSQRSTTVEEHLRDSYVGVTSVRSLRCSAGTGASEEDSSSVHILAITTEDPIPQPNPGDVVEVFVPNDTVDAANTVGEVCARLGVNPNAWCELHRSPFVPEDHFPPWLPLRRAITVWELLTYFVDISSCSYLLRPTFFQGLLRVLDSSHYAITPLEAVTTGGGHGSPELLAQCASAAEGPRIFQSIMNRGNPLCYPSLLDVLDAFPFVKLPLDRLLEISAPLRPRKFSIAGVKVQATNDVREFQLCLRKVVRPRRGNSPAASAPAAAQQLAKTLNTIAESRTKVAASTSGAVFRGHVSYPLCRYGTSSEGGTLEEPPHSGRGLQVGKVYVGTSLFRMSTFGKGMRSALATFTHSPPIPTARVFLIGAGTGIAPLMAAVEELVRLREKQRSCPSEGQHSHEDSVMRRGQNSASEVLSTMSPFPFHVWYGASTVKELVYHEDLTHAKGCGALAAYSIALSRETVRVSLNGKSALPKYVTDLLQMNADDVKESLTSAGGMLFACGPPKALASIRSSLERILGEADDDDSMREQRVLLLEEKSQVLFDVWSTIRDF